MLKSIYDQYDAITIILFAEFDRQGTKYISYCSKILGKIQILF